MTTLTASPAAVYVTRVLPPEDWPRLAGTEAERLWPLLNPAHAQVIVVEKDGVIVGCWTLMTVLHAECVWIAPDERGRITVAKRLLSKMRELVRRAGHHTVATAADSDLVRGLLTKLQASRLPGDHYVFRVD